MTRVFWYSLIILSFISLLFWSVPKKGKSNRKLKTMSFENGIPIIHLGEKAFPPSNAFPCGYYYMKIKNVKKVGDH